MCACSARDQHNKVSRYSARDQLKSLAFLCARSAGSARDQLESLASPARDRQKDIGLFSARERWKTLPRFPREMSASSARDLRAGSVATELADRFSSARDNRPDVA